MSELNVNVHAHSERAHERVRSNSKLQGFMEARPSQPEPWWSKYFKWEEHLTVAGRVIEKGWVVPQPLGIALLVIILGGVGGLYWRIIDKQIAQDQMFAAKMQEQRDLLIRLDQRLIDKNVHDDQRFEQIERKQQDELTSAEAWRGVTNKDIALLKAKR